MGQKPPGGMYLDGNGKTQFWSPTDVKRAEESIAKWAEDEPEPVNLMVSIGTNTVNAVAGAASAVAGGVVDIADKVTSPLRGSRDSQKNVAVKEMI